jgi:hypothetical protein
VFGDDHVALHLRSNLNNLSPRRRDDVDEHAFVDDDGAAGYVIITAVGRGHVAASGVSVDFVGVGG